MARPCWFLLVILGLSACGGGSSGSNGRSGGASQLYLNLIATPSTLFVYPNSSFTISLAASTNASATPSVTMGTLPPGITTATAFPLLVPSTGATVSFQAASSLSAGPYTLTFNGSAGSLTASTSVAASLETSVPGFLFARPVFIEVGVPLGGSGQIQFEPISSSGLNPATYNIALSVSGLPPGTTATINPPTVTVGQTATVTITAGTAAPISQNVRVTLTGTPAISAPSANASFLVDVTRPPGSLANNKTAYVSTEATPYSAVFDRAHKLIFASNDTWDRVDVISDVTHAIVSSIPLPEPRGIDITQDNSIVWVVSGSRQVFAINTTTFAVQRYLLPLGPLPYWEGDRVYALSDGTLMMALTPGKNAGGAGTAIWNPQTNALTIPTPPTSTIDLGMFRSGDGTRVYFISSDSGGAAFYYNVATQSFSKVYTLGGYAIDAAVNLDGSRIVVCDANGPNVYDGDFNFVGSVPGCGAGGPPFFEGGTVFSADNLYLYQEILANVPMIAKIDAKTLNIISISPAMPMIPVMTELSPPYYVPDPFAVDDTGMVLGLEDWGIAFDDSNFPQSYSPAQPGSPVFMQHMTPYSGPLSGGTRSGGFGNAFSITPDVWYGQNLGLANLTNNNLTITSPSTTTSGPVDLKMLFPDGEEVFDPLFFSYGPTLKYSLLAGGSPQGGALGQIIGYGLPGDVPSGTLKIGSSNATLQVPANGNGLPFGFTPYPEKLLTYTVPAGSTGLADITITTPDGTSTLPKSFLYAKSVNDYASTDTFSAVLYDNKRNQVYLSAGNHIDVFSLVTNQFLNQLNPPSLGGTKQMAGLALTPDENLLLAADTPDNSLAVINPDNPAAAFAIAVPANSLSPFGGPCTYGPTYVAGAANSLAVVENSVPGVPSCTIGGPISLVNLSSLQVTSGTPCGGSSSYIEASADGTKVAFGGSVGEGGLFCIYDVNAGTASKSAAYQLYGAAFSGDGQIAASQFVFTDSSANVVGRVGRPDIYYDTLGGNNSAMPNLQEPKLNAAGSLYYMAYPNFIDIIDVRHGTIRVRFSLSETVQNSLMPLAIDSSGRFAFLLTDKGLTVVDLGQAPLSIGWLSQSSAAEGSQITIRGSGFDTSVTATVGGSAATVTATDSSTLTLAIPNIGAGPATIVLSRADGTNYTAADLLTIQ